jgi:hypothetical protein
MSDWEIGTDFCVVFSLLLKQWFPYSFFPDNVTLWESSTGEFKVDVETKR